MEGSPRQPARVDIGDLVEAAVKGIQRAQEERDAESPERAERFRLRELPGTITMGIVWQPSDGPASDDVTR